MEEEATTQTQPSPLTALNERRIMATSVRGDNVWQICQPVLEYLIANGDEAAKADAIRTRAYWEAEQKWLIDLLNNNGYFFLAQHAMRDPRAFEKALCTMPACTGMQMDYYPENGGEPIKVDVIAYLALKAGERHNERYRIRYKTFGKKRKH